MAKVKYSDKLITLKCAVCKHRNYYTRKNKKTVTRKVELQKYCPTCRKKTKHTEGKLTSK